VTLIHCTATAELNQLCYRIVRYPLISSPLRTLPHLAEKQATSFPFGPTREEKAVLVTTCIPEKVEADENGSNYPKTTHPAARRSSTFCRRLIVETVITV
jgi:hypothetical protein